MTSKIVVMDDEAYVMVDLSETPGKYFLHSTKSKDVDYQRKLKVKTKFPEKYLVW